MAVTLHNFAAETKTSAFMAQNVNKRYVWLIDTIRQHGHISIDELQRKWRCSSLNDDHSELAKRTFFRHKDAVLEQFDIEIKCDKSDCYYIPNADNIEGSIRQWLLTSISINRVLNEASGMRDRVLFETVPSSSEWLVPLIGALRDRVCVRVEHRSFERTESRVFDCHPYCLKLFKQRWYLLARREGETSPLLYGLDRIQQVERLSQPAQIPADFSATDYFNGLFGVYAGTDVQVCEVLLRATALEAKYIDSLPLHHSQRVVSTDEQGTVYSLVLRPTRDFRIDLLGRGAAVEVLEPQWLRDEMKQQIAAMMERYK